MMEYDRARLKLAAKQSMKYQRPHPMLITLLFIVVTNVGSQIVSAILGAASGSGSLSQQFLQGLADYGDPEDALAFMLLSFTPQQLILSLVVGVLIANIIISLWTGLMQTGYAGFCLGMARGQQPQTGMLFSAFPQWAGVLLTQFLLGLFIALWSILFCVGAGILFGVIAVLFSNAVGLAFILFLAVYIALMVGIVWVSLRYAMVNFIVIDQGVTGLAAIRESKRMMKGNMGKLLVLQLSFLGWYLLEAAVILVATVIALPTLGVIFSSAGSYGDAIGAIAGGALAVFGVFFIAAIAISVFNLWLTPYVTGSEALFYDWARGGTIPGGPGGYNGQGGWGGYGGQGGPGGYNGQGGWGQPPRQDGGGYNWTPTPGPNSGRGIGSGPRDGQQQPPKSPKPPKDDPWE